MYFQELDHEHHFQTLDHVGSIHLEALKRKLLSRSLQGAVWTILKSMASYTSATSILEFETLQNTLESLASKLQFVKHLNTRFFLLPNSLDITRVTKDCTIPDWGDGSQHQSLYFINRSKTSILVAEPPVYISVLDVIAIVVSQVLESPTPLPIGSLFTCPEGSETAVADSLRLNSYKRENELSSNGLIGKEILPQDAGQVQFHPLRPFYRGEIVAWRSQNGEKLKYGRVPEDVRPSAGQALYRFKVETTPGVNEPLVSSQVFSFRSTSIGNGNSSETLLDSVSASTSNSSYVETPESCESGKTRSSQVCTFDLLRI